MGMELMLVPRALRPEVEGFLRSGGRVLGQPAGAGAPERLGVATAAGARGTSASPETRGGSSMSRPKRPVRARCI